MAAPLIAVLDETGTTNRPQIDATSNFGVGVILCEEAQVPALAAAAHEIATATGNRDFKYKHVQKAAQGRAAFLRAVNSLERPCGLFGFYSAGGALLNEKDRAVEEMEFLG